MRKNHLLPILALLLAGIVASAWAVPHLSLIHI